MRNLFLSFSLKGGTHGISRRGSGEDAREALTLTQGLQIFPGSTEPPHPRQQQPSPPLFLLTQAACVQPRVQESGPIRAGLGSRGARGEAGSLPAPGASIYKPHSGLLRVSWAAQWLPHAPMYSKELQSQGPPALFFHPIELTHSYEPSHVWQHILTHWVAFLSSLPSQLRMPRVLKTQPRVLKTQRWNGRCGKKGRGPVMSPSPPSSTHPSI